MVSINIARIKLNTHLMLFPTGSTFVIQLIVVFLIFVIVVQERMHEVFILRRFITKAAFRYWCGHTH